MPTPKAAPMPPLLESAPPKPLPGSRTTSSVAAELRAIAAAGELELPRPGAGDTVGRWAALAALGRRDLVLARLAEGHTDALAILAEAGRTPVPDALYGVWAARSSGTGAQLTDGGLSGTVRFCSGATVLDRALVVAGDRLVEVDLSAEGVRARPDSWQAVGMDASDSADVEFDQVQVQADALVGPPGWYVTRPGFAFGGGGVAAVWLGGAAGIVDSVRTWLVEREHVDEHQCAHLGALHTTVRATEALLARAAELIDQPTRDSAGSAGRDHLDRPDQLETLIQTCRAAAERTACEVLDRAPKVAGPTPMCRDRRFAQRLADLLVYVRQHHAERDLATLGRRVLAGEHDR
ncbi:MULTISPECIES: acyl-CoA dehydrogenase family protein [Actinoalloteichus]|uniref:Acyl-CoA dehydrogenase n=1 Tax=Actinoalloteichus fjordicus TaxID=1612552 RepID=A0AAC9LC43_9PSEU|nr:MULTISPECIES: acyl-CoA dehydrogenase family protein [Actinoalloteichus]APU13619.1 acyl-CoA dehydrogenase [Actinoalloteichus fjordicus]APU19565.1 acyl-CoA dehydrogenase [Actinoalloteichus sp. GBA129-24]